MNRPSRLPALIVIVCLVLFGGLLIRSVNQLQVDSGPQTVLDRTPAGTIHDAAERGDLPALQAFLKQGVPPDRPLRMGERWRQGMTPLMLAALAGQTQAVGLLLESGARVNAASGDGKTALMYAAGWADADTVHALLDAQARVDMRSEDGWTALMLAAGRGSARSVELLIRAGADVNARNRWGQTALIAAARSEETPKVRLLLTYQADPNLADADGVTALAVACAGDAPPEMVEALINAGADVNRADRDGVTPLMRAAERGSLPKATLLLDRGANPYAKDRKGWTAADWARSRGDRDGDAVVALLQPR